MTEDEDWEDYIKGGYHPVRIGGLFRSTVVRKLGWGHFSTVWSAKDDKCVYVAIYFTHLYWTCPTPEWTDTVRSMLSSPHLDIPKCTRRNKASSTSHHFFYSSIPRYSNPTHHALALAFSHSPRPIARLLPDHLRHKSPNGVHVRMVFDVIGENLLGLIKRH